MDSPKPLKRYPTLELLLFDSQWAEITMHLFLKQVLPGGWVNPALNWPFLFPDCKGRAADVYVVGP